MATITVRHDRSVTVLRWVARIWSLLLLGLIVSVSLDTGPEGIRGLPVAEYYTLAMTALAQIGLLLAFHWERSGGVLALAASLAVPVIYVLSHGHWHSGLIGATLIWGTPAVLFLVCWRRSRGLQH